ncbi:diguanylate cyclase [Chloroflexota bacterium]
MNPWAIIPLVSCLAYTALTVLVLLQARTRVNVMFALFLAAAAIWSLTSFMLTSSFFVSTQALNLWNGLLLAAVVWSNFTFYHFIRAYNNRPAGIVAYFGYTLALTLLALSVSDNLVKDTYLENGYLYHNLGLWLYVIVGTLTPLLFVGLWMLVQRYRRSTDPIDRNKTMYLTVGWSIMGIWAAINANVPLLALLPTDHLGALVNASIIAYAILRFQLLDIRVVARKGLAFSMTVIAISIAYSGFILLLYQFFSGLQLITIIIVTAFTAVVSLLGRPLRHSLERWVDRLFHQETFAYRQALRSFNEKMSNILNLDEVANEMLTTICRALRLTQARLFLQEASGGELITRFAYPQTKEEIKDNIGFGSDNPAAMWLAKEGKPINLEDMANIPHLKGLWTAEKMELAASGLILLHPVRSRDTLIGILALGKKQGDTLFYPEDLELVKTIANQAGVVIDNAQFYARAEQRARVDELTSLFNRRHFDESLNHEVKRHSRYGSVLSLAFLDVDNFKGYNDTLGHPAGDKLLTQIGYSIKKTLRNIDLAFRYGGDEFAIIMPHTPADDAFTAAERVRSMVAAEMISRQIAISVSIGLVTWPGDGLTADDLINAADSALYHAKRTGRNRTCTISQMLPSRGELLESPPTNEKETLNTIYALAATIEARDRYTYGHSHKVGAYAVALAEALHLPSQKVALVSHAALLHDIGKIGIIDGVLNKTGSLTVPEMELIRSHPQLSRTIVGHVPSLTPCLPAILHHHERWDGTGYPARLKGETIPLEARIMAIADAFDAMISYRPYRAPLSYKEAIDELTRCAGSQFDPTLVEVFLPIALTVNPEKVVVGEKTGQETDAIL